MNKDKLFLEFLFEKKVIPYPLLKEDDKLEGKNIAKKLDIYCNGWWEELKKFVFTDRDVTQTSFTASDIKEARQKLEKVRMAFAK